MYCWYFSGNCWIKLKFIIMEETDSNVRVEVNEIHHRDITPNQSLCKQIKNVAFTAEEVTENPEFVVMRKSTTVQAVSNEEVIIAKHNSALNPTPNFTVVCSEGGGSTMEIDVSSQESAMDIASQESMALKDSNSEELLSCNSISLREEAVLVREKEVQKREETVLECEKKLKLREKDVAEREEIVIQMEMDIQKQQERLNIKEKEISDRQLALKKREAAVQIREFEADGYEVILRSSKSTENNCLSAKRTKKI